jgi:acetylglutamate kinase
MTPVTVVKFGGELLDDPARLTTVVTALARAGAGSRPTVVVHGGGKEIDAAMKRAGLDKRQVEGLRITDAATLEVVVAVLAGTINTRLVAALNTAGVSAVGLTGADGRCGLCELAPPHRTVDGQTIDLGRVGVPAANADMRLLQATTAAGFVPVVACIGVTAGGELLNVNADTLAGHLAAQLRARRLVIAGTTAGVLDRAGQTLAALDTDDAAAVITSNTATAGMVAKLRACADALNGGAGEVTIVDGRDAADLEAAIAGMAPANATRIVAARRQEKGKAS